MAVWQVVPSDNVVLAVVCWPARAVAVVAWCLAVRRTTGAHGRMRWAAGEDGGAVPRETSSSGSVRYIEANRRAWDAWTRNQLGSAHHQDAAAFRDGRLTLRPIERRELGDVAGKSLLHLLCNMGSDTLSWARSGANVTGVDVSAEAIERARALATATDTRARFIASDLYALPNVLDEQFDVVYSAYGVLCWLPDLPRWARIAASFLKPGGTFYLVDMHPVGNALAPVAEPPSTMLLSARAPYFGQSEPVCEPGEPPAYSWTYSLGEALSALTAAGLRLEFVHEYPMTFYRQFATLVEGGDGYWHWPAGADGGSPACDLPLLFSVRARRS